LAADSNDWATAAAANTAVLVWGRPR
jgi:hypothetical protein